jgi:hypothetical protein
MPAIVMVTGQVAATEVASAIGMAEAAAWLVEVTPFPLAILALPGTGGALTDQGRAIVWVETERAA